MLKGSGAVRLPEQLGIGRASVYRALKAGLASHGRIAVKEDVLEHQRLTDPDAANLPQCQLCSPSTGAMNDRNVGGSGHSPSLAVKAYNAAQPTASAMNNPMAVVVSPKSQANVAPIAPIRRQLAAGPGFFIPMAYTAASTSSMLSVSERRE